MTKRKYKILITPLGTQTAVEIIKSLKNIPQVELYGCDTDLLNVGSCFVKESAIVPSLFDSRFDSSLEKLVKKWNIDLIYPTHDWFMTHFAEKSYIGKAKCMVPGEKEVAITLSKERTYEYFRKVLKIPKIYKINNIKNGNFPLFIKPKKGRGSEHAFKINNKTDLKYLYNIIEDPIIIEYLPGREYTVDCLCDMSGQLLSAVPRERIKILRGISAIAKTVQNDAIQEMALKISNNLKLPGSWFFQCKENAKGVPVLIEINSRIGGTLSLSRIAGVNIPWLSVLTYMNEKIEDVFPYRKDIIVTRYLKEKYISRDFDRVRCIIWDLDDTLWHGRMLEDNIELIPEIPYILQELKNKGFILSVISRNPHLSKMRNSQIIKILKKNNIPDVFFHIIINNKPKSENIKVLCRKMKLKYNEIIYVDDSFSEKKEIISKLPDIWCFDSNCAEELLNF